METITIESITDDGERLLLSEAKKDLGFLPHPFDDIRYLETQFTRFEDYLSNLPDFEKAEKIRNAYFKQVYKYLNISECPSFIVV